VTIVLTVVVIALIVIMIMVMTIITMISVRPIALYHVHITLPYTVSSNSAILHCYEHLVQNGIEFHLDVQYSVVQYSTV
jgi:hypothetical protein